MIIKNIFIIIFFLFVTPFTSCTEVNSDRKSNEIPMFGNKVKSTEAINADNKFIELAIIESGSREVAAEALTKKGWEYIHSQDPSSAMKRFNQAWLLNPENFKIYWGFGAALGMQSKFEESFQMFVKAENMAPENVNLIIDFGRTYGMRACAGNGDDKELYLQKGIELFRKAEKLESNDSNVYRQWAYANLCAEQYIEAWEMVHKAQSIDANSVDPKFIEQLSLKFPAPVTGPPPNRVIENSDS